MSKTADKLQRMRIFVAVVNEGSFVKAAASLELKAPTVSKAIQLLEEDMRARLIIRTTRTVNVTDIGQRYYEKAKFILNEVDELEDETRQAGGSARGKLKISAPVSFGEHVLGPLIPEFLKLFPEIEIELDLTGDMRDLKRDGYDIGIRNGMSDQLQDFYYLPFRSLTPTVVASPSYIAEYGSPTKPEQLAEHEVVVLRAGSRLFNRWTFKREGESDYRFHANGRYVCNHIQNGIEAAVQGLGIVNTYAFYIEALLKRGKLVRLLPDYQQPDVQRYAYYHQKRTLSPKLDEFLTFMEQRLGE
jgi:DNA-binding transcriptional LysR family regulator